MVELTVQQVEKLREMSPLYEFVKEGINIKDIQWAQHWLLSSSQIAMQVMGSNCDWTPDVAATLAIADSSNLLII